MRDSPTSARPFPPEGVREPSLSRSELGRKLGGGGRIFGDRVFRELPVGSLYKSAVGARSDRIIRLD